MLVAETDSPVNDITAQPRSVEFRAKAHRNKALKLARTSKKIREAEFFLSRLLAKDASSLHQESEAADFYLSAFLNSACSVNNILRTENPDKYESWSRDWFAHRLAEDGELMDFFLEQQSGFQEEGAADAGDTFTTVSLVEFAQYIHRRRANLFKAHRIVGAPHSAFTATKGFRDGPNDSVGAGCCTYLNLLKQLAAEFEHDAS